MLASALGHYLRWHARRVQWSMANPREAQALAFARLQRLLRGSEVARTSGFERCRTLDDCRTLLVSDSESLKPLLKRVFELGARAGNVFGASKLFGFARTSGTLGDAKVLPLNAAYLSSLDRTLVRMVASHIVACGDWSTVLSGKRVLLGSRPRCGTSPTGLMVSDISGLIPTRTWRSIRWLYAPRHRDLWLDDWSERAERTLDQLQGKQVISLSGIPAMASDFVRRAKERSGASHAGELWPHLRHFVYGAMHLSAKQRSALVHSWFGGDWPLHFHETYFATEGPLAFSFEPDNDGMALSSLENLYLFRADDSNELLFADELHEGRSYSLHVTTPGGLVNYAIGDRVEVLSARPLLIGRITRMADELSLTGEKLTVHHIDLALEAVGLSAVQLRSLLPVVWVEPGERPRLVWGLPEGAVGDDAQGLSARLDEELCRLNVLYAEALRLEKVIAPSRIARVPRAVFERYRDSKLGVGQFKMKRLFESAEALQAAYQWSEPSSAPASGGRAES